MKTWKIVTTAVLALLAVSLLATSAYAWCGGWGGMGGYGYGYNNAPYATQPGTTTPIVPTTPTSPTSTQYYQPVYPFQFGGGCFGRLGNGYGFGGMMSGFGYTAPYTSTGTTLSINTAVTIAQNYVTSIGNPDLVVKQVEEYTGNFYVQVNEKSTGFGAFQLLIDKYTGSIYPEMGPNMMWNTKYGMMRGGILGGIYGTPTITMPVTATQATANGQQYLTAYLPGTTTGDVTTFYGYYTVEVLQGTTTYGMLSVNGYTGQVWYHTWHGTFIQELQVS